MSTWTKRAPTYTIVLFAAVLCFSRFRLGLEPLQTYDDDFFYYLRASSNLLQTGRCTFDGVRLTNGFHPLWFLVITAIGELTPRHWFFVGLQIVECGLGLVTYFLLRGLFRKQTAHRLLADGSALIACTQGMLLARGGMEVGLVFPLAAGVLAYRCRAEFQWCNGQAATYGFLLSLLILARLDSALLVILLLAADLYSLRHFHRKLVGRFACLCAGGLLVPMYLAANRYWFQVWLPLSGEAKQLRVHHWPSLNPYRSVFLAPSVPLQALLWTAILLMLASLLQYRRLRAPLAEDRIALALVVFPAVHLLVISILSDWGLWPWYLYPMVLVFYGAAMLLLPTGTATRESWFRESWTGYATWVACVAVCVFAIVVSRPSAAADGRYQEDRDLSAFIDTHPGTYAMGDVSGMLSYMVSARMVQTEGLMEDRAYLAAIRREEFLGDVLQRYGATYYIPHPSYDVLGCHAVAEPSQANADSPQLHASVCDDRALFRTHTLGQHQIFALKDVQKRLKQE